MELGRIDKELEAHAAQYRAVEKRLLAKFRDKNPTPLGNVRIFSFT